MNAEEQYDYDENGNPVHVKDYDDKEYEKLNRTIERWDDYFSKSKQTPAQPSHSSPSVSSHYL
jgi:hypothetical protein